MKIECIDLVLYLSSIGFELTHLSEHTFPFLARGLSGNMSRLVEYATTIGFGFGEHSGRALLGISKP